MIIAYSWPTITWVLTLAYLNFKCPSEVSRTPIDDWYLLGFYFIEFVEAERIRLYWTNGIPIIS